MQWQRHRTSMLPIFGILVFVLYLLDGAAHRPAGSTIHFFSILACISFIGEFFRSRALVLWEHRKSSIDLARRLSAGPMTYAAAPQTVKPEHPLMSIRMWSCLLDRWWYNTLTGAKDWTILAKMGLAGVALLTIAQRISPLAPWRQIARVPFGFSGMLLIDVSLGFGGFLFVYDGKLARRVRQVRDWLQAPW
jgi:hypothetical protein